MNSLSPRLLLICALASFLVALIVHQNMVQRMWNGNSAKVGVPIAGYSSDINDNYLYFSLVKRGAGACRGPADEQTVDASGNPLACTYVSALVVNNLIYQALRLLAPNRVVALGLLLIVQTGLLALAALAFIQNVLQRRFGFLGALAVAGGVIFLSDAFSWSLRFHTLYLNLPNIWQYEANVVRLVSPTLYWTLGLFALIALLALLKHPTPLRYGVAGALLALSAASSIAIGANIGAGVGLAFLITTIRHRRIDFPLLFAGVMLLAGLVWQEWFFRQFYNTEFGSQLGHGSFRGVRFDPVYLILLVPVFLGRIGTRQGSSQVLLKMLLVGSILIGAFSESVELGDRLWLRGASMIAFVLTICWTISMLLGLWRPLHVNALTAAVTRSVWWRHAYRALAIATLVVTFVGISEWTRPYDSARWYGFVARERQEAIDWIAANTTKGDVVASGNIDDTNLIEFYTDGTAFTGLFGMSALPFDELIRRYLFTIDLLEQGDDVFHRLATSSRADLNTFFAHIDARPTTPYDQDAYQAVGFYELLVYHSYNAAVPQLFANGPVDSAFVERLKQLRNEARQRHYTFKYLLLRATDALRRPADFGEVFRNTGYVVYAPERTNSAVRQ